VRQNYQFWVRATSDGRFSIGNVRQGAYSIYAWVPGILGDYMSSAPITIAPGSDIDVGDLVFSPPRTGPTLWEVGVPDRSAEEFYVPDPDPKYASKLFLNKDRLLMSSIFVAHMHAVYNRSVTEGCVVTWFCMRRDTAQVPSVWVVGEVRRSVP
jgi:hypothetical protein